MQYPGGKGSCYQHIISLMPPHRVYIEPFLDGGNVLERKKPATLSIGIDLDPLVIEMWRARGLPALDLHNTDALPFLDGYPFSGDELVYCDPPYLHSTRSHRRIYEHELSDQAHAALLAVLVRLPCPVILSGYASPFYDDVLVQQHGWRRQTFRTGTRGGARTEVLWSNFSPDWLHDARFAGEGYRDRERMKKKIARWARKFAALPFYEQQSILEVLIQLTPARPVLATATTPRLAVGAGAHHQTQAASGGTIPPTPAVAAAPATLPGAGLLKAGKKFAGR